MFCLLALSIQPAPGYNLGHLTSKSGMQVKHDLPPYGLRLKFPKCLNNNLSRYEALLNLSAYHLIIIISFFTLIFSNHCIYGSLVNAFIFVNIFPKYKLFEKFI